MKLQERIDSIEDYGILKLDFGEYQGPVFLSRPITIDGGGSTIWAPEGPVLTIDCEDVEIRKLSLEITGDAKQKSGDAGCALKVRQDNRVKFEEVNVRGNVQGVVNEEGEWRYPEVLHLRHVVPHVFNYFLFHVYVPTSCVLRSNVEGLKILSSGLSHPGSHPVVIEVGPLKEDEILFGEIEIKSIYLSRRIRISGGTFGTPSDTVPHPKNNPLLIDGEKEILPPSGASSPSPRRLGFKAIAAAVAAILLVAGIYIFVPWLKNNTFENNTHLQKSLVAVESAINSGNLSLAQREIEVARGISPVDPRVVALSKKIEEGLGQVAQAETLKRLLTEARDQMKSQDHDSAEETVKRVLELDSSNSKALSIRNSIEAARKEAKLQKSLVAVESAVNSGNLSLAQREIEVARGISPVDPRVVALSKKIEEGLGQVAQAETLKRLLTEARDQMKSQDHDSAEETVKRVLELDSSNSKAVSIRNSIEAARKEAKLQKSLVAVESAINSGNLSLAQRELEVAHDISAVDPRVVALSKKIEEGLGQVAQAETIERLLTEARDQMKSQDYDSAEETVKRVLELDSSNSKAVSIRNSIEAARKEAKLQKSLVAVESAVNSGNLSLAQRELKVARGISPVDPRVVALSKKIEEGLGQVAQAETLKRLLTEARDQMKSQDYDSAEETVKRVLELDSSNSEAVGILNSLADARIVKLMSEAEVNIENGECSKAAATLRQIIALSPGNTRARKLLDEVSQARGEIKIFAEPWAYVYIDGENTGHITPCIISMNCGTYELALKNPESPLYEERIITIKILPGSSLRVIAHNDSIVPVSE